MSEGSEGGDDHLPPHIATTKWAENNWSEEYERPRGMLTDTDRRYLWGIVEYQSRQSRSERERDMRTRIANAILDFQYLTMLDETQRRKTFDEIEEEALAGGLRESMSHLVQFIYQSDDVGVEWLEETIAHGIANAERADRWDDQDEYWMGRGKGGAVDVEISVDKGYNIDEIEQQFREGGQQSVTTTELGILLKTHRLDADDLEELEDSSTLPPGSGHGEAPRVGLEDEDGDE